VIPFNKPQAIEKEFEYIKDAINRSFISGDGYYTTQCHKWFEDNLPIKKALLTHSCTAALEMAVLLLGLKVGDEVIMPSYTFVSTANAFVLRGVVPVFVDINPITLNLDEELVERAITKKTKAIVPVHYAGMSCDMDKIIGLAKKYNLYVVEDAAQAVGSFYKNKPLGTIGDLGAYSFHETKNVISGEGGALLVNDAKFSELAEIIREKGTNRSKFFRGQVDKYTWVDIGSSYLPSDIIAAYLYSQLENIEVINKKRMYIWNFYNDLFVEYERRGVLRRPVVPSYCSHNAHMYYVLFNNVDERSKFISYCKLKEILTVFHYVPLHSSPAGKKFGKTLFDMSVTDSVSDRLVRMPMYYGLSDNDLSYIKDVVSSYFN